MILPPATCFKYVISPWELQISDASIICIDTNLIRSILGVGQTLQVLGARFPSLYECGYASFASVCSTKA